MASTNKVLPLPLPPALAEIAFGTSYLVTKEFARIIRREMQTIRKLLSQKGEVYGIRPIKVGNRWLWDVRDVASLFPGAGA
jgi:hypothetical protein